MTATPGEGQLTLDAMPRRLFSCTPTRLATFDCPRRYHLTYLQRPAPPRGGPWAHNTIGAAVHLALAQWWDLPVGDRTPAAGAALVARAWQQDGFRDEQQSLVWRGRAADWVRTYLARHVDGPGADAVPGAEPVAAGPGDRPGRAAGPAAPADPPPAPDASDARADVGTDPGSRSAGGDPVGAGATAADRAAEPPLGTTDTSLDPAVLPAGVERTVGTHTEGLAVHGRVDRLDLRDGELVVVDYKTGRSVPTDDDARASTALALYALAAGRTLRRLCRRVELHHLPTGTVAAAVHTRASVARHVARAEATAHDVVAATDTLAAGADVDAVFPPVTGPHCGWCDLRRHCPEGQRAAPARAPWDAVTEPV